MTTHTPGPWMFEWCESSLDVYGPKGQCIATAHQGEGKHEVNASLIAAAPMMLAALKLAKEALYNVPEVGRKYDQQHSHTHTRAVLEIEAAIAAAEGGKK